MSATPPSAPEDPVSSPPDEQAGGESLEQALAAAEAKAEENWNQYLRAMAELENYRRRAEREVDNARKYAIERFAQELVNVGDALEAGIAADGSDSKTVIEGATATLRALHAAFQKAGIAIVDPAGQSFDPNWHEAMVAQASAEHPPGTVLSVIQKGYTLNGRLLRPARVIVSKTPAENT